MAAIMFSSRVSGVFALIPGFQDHKPEAGKRLLDLVDQIVAGHFHHVRHPRSFQRYFTNPFDYGLGAPDGGGVGQLNQHQKVALILFGHKPRGYCAEPVTRQKTQSDKRRQHNVPQPGHYLDTGSVPVGQFAETIVEGPEKGVGFAGSFP